MNSPANARLMDLVVGLSRAVDLVSPRVADHHRRVAIVADRLSGAAEISPSLRRTIVLAASLHDVGALSLRERIESLDFETTHPHEHAEIGARLLEGFAPLVAAGGLVRYHHVRWDGRDCPCDGPAAPPGSQILHLADRIAVLIDPRREPLEQADPIRRHVAAEQGRMFAPRWTDVFLSLADHEDFWFDCVAARETAPGGDLGDEPFAIGTAVLAGVADLFRRIVDFRSRFTATHSAAVAEVAAHLARRSGFGDEAVQSMRVAGHLHDLGKLAIPAETLEKPAPLDEAEQRLMRAHPYHTDRTLAAVPALQTLRRWSAQHHERPDGGGYPFHLHGPDLSVGARIMAVADVFAALREDRPYRRALGAGETRGLMGRLAADRVLDAEVLALMLEDFDAIDGIRASAQARARHEYAALRAS